MPDLAQLSRSVAEGVRCLLSEYPEGGDRNDCDERNDERVFDEALTGLVGDEAK